MKITLSQFIGYSAKTTTSARMNAVSDIKYSQYSVLTDYWKPIRDGLHKVLAGKMSFDQLMDIASKAPEAKNKRKNQMAAVNKLQLFFGKLKYEYNPSISATWHNTDETLTINSSPEFVLKTNGKVLLLKVNYRVSKPDEKLTKWNLPATLFLMDQSVYKDRPKNSIPAVLNLQNSKLITLDDIKTPKTDIVEAEAAMFVALWSTC